MSTSDPVAPSASALRLVVAAERLFALRGIDGVALRQVAAAAGSANNSAVHYHFGSKQGLITAIFQHRLPRLIDERNLLLARCDRSDLRSRLEAQFLPVLALAEAPDNHYVSFVEQLQRHELGQVDALRELPAAGQRSNDEFRRDLDDLVPDLPPTVRALRIGQALGSCVHAAADRERAVTSGRASVPFDLFASSLFDGVAGFLTAPVSEATAQRLERTDRPEHHELRLL